MWMLAALAFFAQSQSPPAPVIRVPVRLVTAPTLVFSREGYLMPGLRKADFRLYDNGHPQSVALDSSSAPISIVIAVQVNQDVRQYVPFIAKTGSVFDALLVGETGEAAVLTYGARITEIKPFDTGDVQSALRNIAGTGRRARMFDAGLRGIDLLKTRSIHHTRVLLFIGQPRDIGSESDLDKLRRRAQEQNVAICALTLPEIGKSFVSDNFSLEGLSSRAERGGFRAGVNLGELVTVLNRVAEIEKGADVFSVLAAGTGGTQLRFRRQSELEGAISAMGVELRSTYLLSYSPSSTEAGYHTIHIDVLIPGAKAFSRPGYWLGAN